jgi:hypothetical protein
MKYLFILCLYSISSMAAECKLTGITQNEQKIETSFVTNSLESCAELAKNTKANNFYNLIEKDDLLVETKYSLKEEEGPTSDIISFEDESNL